MSELNNASGDKLYEIGFLVIPSVDADKVKSKITEIKKTITGAGAEVVKEIQPDLINLAYPMVKKISDVNHKFDKAHFGSILFNSEAEAAEQIKHQFEKDNDILRFLLVKTVNDPEHSTNKIPKEKTKETRGKIKTEEAASEPERPSEFEDSNPESDNAPNSAAGKDVDEAIDELVS
ncbi:MAG TPA: 30S ribosomal protein S6 [Candidatus Paceibacterota bacterium]|nr:30S ribosomal protein S6 [Candidatus Paceibacterota bacterium]HRZ34172.1 30S ribosomal protein S6 [Candidatus Paceibacterota bacterium]